MLSSCSKYSPDTSVQVCNYFEGFEVFIIERAIRNDNFRLSVKYHHDKKPAAAKSALLQ